MSFDHFLNATALPHRKFPDENSSEELSMFLHMYLISKIGKVVVFPVILSDTLCVGVGYVTLVAGCGCHSPALPGPSYVCEEAINDLPHITGFGEQAIIQDAVVSGDLAQ